MPVLASPLGDVTVVVDRRGGIEARLIVARPRGGKPYEMMILVSEYELEEGRARPTLRVRKVGGASPHFGWISGGSGEWRSTVAAIRADVTPLLAAFAQTPAYQQAKLDADLAALRATQVDLTSRRDAVVRDLVKTSERIAQLLEEGAVDVESGAN